MRRAAGAAWENFMTSRLHHLNQLLVNNHFYPLLLSSGLALGLYAGRAWYINARWFSFLVWNLFLAWVPYFWSLWALNLHRCQPQRWWLLLLPGTLWLLFFPNAPYLITDLIHLRNYPSVPFWYDIGMLASFACPAAAITTNVVAGVDEGSVPTDSRNTAPTPGIDSTREN